MKKIWAGIAVWIAVFALTAGVFSVNSLAEMYDTSENEIVKQTSISRGKIGRSMNVSMEIFNNSDMEWKDVYVQITNTGDRTMRNPSDYIYGEYVYPFEGASEKYVGTIRGIRASGSDAPDKEYHKSVSVPVKVRADLEAGYYYVLVEVYVDGGHGKGTQIAAENVNIYVSQPKAGDEDDDEVEKQINFVLGEGQSTPYGVYPNVLEYTINMRNAGLNDALDVTVEMVLDADSTKFPFDINDGNYNRTFEKVAAGETVTLPYSMAIRSDTYSGFYPIGFHITYRDRATGDLLEEENTFWVRIKNKEKEDKSSAEWNEHNNTSARLVVDGFHTIPEEIIAGEPFQLILRMKNASSNIAASNIMFTLESETSGGSGGSSSGGGSVFTTQSGSSSAVVNSLSPGEVTELQFAMQSIAGIDQRSYYLNIKAKYDSPEYKNAEATVRIDIPVHQIPRMNVGNIEVLPDSINTGSESNVMFPINNTGKVILYNVMVEFEADSIDSSETYVGNIQPGQTGNVDAMLRGIAPTADDGTIKITITYEDEYGEIQDPVEKELTLMVNEPQEEIEDVEVMASEENLPKQGPLQKYMKFIIVGVLLIVLVVIIIVIRVRKKKKAALEGLEDEIF